MERTLFPTLRDYQRPWLRADVLAGVAAGAVVIPQAMAYATIAGLPVQVGLYTCLVPMFVYVALGGSRAMSVSTTSTVATLTGSTLIAAGVAAGARGDVAMLTLEVGVLLLLGWLLHLGSLVENISETVLIGVKTGVGLVVAVGQLPKLLGVTVESGGGFFRQLGRVVAALGDTNVATLLLSLVLLAILLFAGRLVPRLPAPLIVVVVSILAVVILDLPKHGVALIEPVPSGLPLPYLPHPDHAAAMLPGAMAIALMVCMESLAVARSIRVAGEPVPENDRELLAAGAASTLGAFFQAMPAAGGFSQTAINARAGARTQASQLVTVVLAVAVALFLGGVLDHLPENALAAMVVVAVLGLIKPSDFARLARIERWEVWLAAVTTVIALVAGLLAAVAVGVGATLLLVLRELNRVDVVELRRSPTGELRPAVEGDEAEPGVLALRLNAPLYTANVRGATHRLLDRVAATDPRPQLVVLDVTALGQVSVTVLDAVRELGDTLADDGTALWIAALPDRALETAERTRWWPQWESAGRVWPTVQSALEAHHQT